MTEVERAIRKLERWHRDWEIRNRDRLLTPTFATWDEITHEHEWTKADNPSPVTGFWYDQCDHCRVIRQHVEGTPGRIYKLEMQMHADTDRLLEDLRRF